MTSQSASRVMATPIPSARAREQRQRSRDVCDDVTNAVRTVDRVHARRADARATKFEFEHVPPVVANTRWTPSY